MGPNYNFRIKKNGIDIFNRWVDRSIDLNSNQKLFHFYNRGNMVIATDAGNSIKEFRCSFVNGTNTALEFDGSYVRRFV